ncbi:hypothetical protein PM10SUCC1_25080 [Propionigenium maris DSM 9537]|uniref:HTH cro/C1-type domain-containing protein n=1 Tax=Propionigenium maris DSM 9537 TaxID=1123000 RepID=A0A9W6GKW5_9FUSO|nr:hypothetical protein [Propionigenium maris]GLI56994.1 hypothetical protein PM10SUCC1_25080 [Propionigenium maris DSM 9537]
MYEVNEEKRIELGKILKKKRLEKNYGLNQFSIKTGVNKSILSRLESGSVLKINPFMLKDIAKGLAIDYKDLYKIVGYLEENDYVFDNEGKVYFEELAETDEIINRSYELIKHLKEVLTNNEKFIEDLKKMQNNAASSELIEIHQRQIDRMKPSIKDAENRIKNEEYILSLYHRIRELQGIALHGQKFYHDNIDRIKALDELEKSNKKK